MAAKPVVLMLTPWAPIPMDAGSRRVWTACRLLKDEYELHLLSFSRLLRDGAKEAAALALGQERFYFNGIFKSSTAVPQPENARERMPGGLLLPEEIARFYSQDMEAALRSKIQEINPDIVHAEFDLMAPYVWAAKAARPNLPCVLTHHDLSALSLFSSYFREMTGWSKWRRLGDWRNRLSATKALCAKFDAVITVSEGDRRRMSRLIASGRVHSAPTGVDLEHFSGGLPRQEREPDSLVYVGHYPHYPNEEAVLRFAAAMWPLIKAERPAAKFYVVGSGPTDKIKSLAAVDSSIIVTGTVPDVKPFEARAMAMVAPLRLGYGIKGKILEATAMGTPVVSSSSANEAVGGAPKRHLLIADSQRAFARQTVRLLQDEALWSRLSREGRALVEERHDWRARAQDISRVYRQVLGPWRELPA